MTYDQWLSGAPRARSVLLSTALGVAAFALTFSAALLLGRGLAGSALAALLVPVAVSGGVAVGLAVAFVVSTALQHPAGRRRVVRAVSVLVPLAAVVAMVVYAADPTAVRETLGPPGTGPIEPQTPQPSPIRTVGVVDETPPPAPPGEPGEPAGPGPGTVAQPATPDGGGQAGGPGGSGGPAVPGGPAGEVPTVPGGNVGEPTVPGGPTQGPVVPEEPAPRPPLPPAPIPPAEVPDERPPTVERPARPRGPVVNDGPGYEPRDHAKPRAKKRGNGPKRPVPACAKAKGRPAVCVSPKGAGSRR